MDKKIINIKIQVNPLDNSIEKFVLKKINKTPPESYDHISLDELNNIYKLVLGHFNENQTKYFSTKIIESIRANFIREHMIYMHKKLVSSEKNIIHDYKLNKSLLDLVKKYDGSPLNLLRIIFKSKYHKKLTQIVSNMNILNPKDKFELNWAIEHDKYALVNQNEILNKSINFEKKIEEILTKLNVKFKTQCELANEQIKQNKKAFNTPDFLIINDLYIGDFKINWIDAKNFYGSSTNFMMYKIKSQTNKYINAWGTGCIIFSIGFNSDLKINNIKMIDFNSFENYKKL